MITRVRLWGGDHRGGVARGGGGTLRRSIRSRLPWQQSQLSPLVIPLAERVYEFPMLPRGRSHACRGCWPVVVAGPVWQLR